MKHGGSPPTPGYGLRVLVVEDRFMVARRLATLLRELGCEAVGPATALEDGFRLLQQELDTLDAAVLDIDLKGEPVYPLARALLWRRVPLVFATG